MKRWTFADYIIYQFWKLFQWFSVDYPICICWESWAKNVSDKLLDQKLSLLACPPPLGSHFQSLNLINYIKRNQFTLFALNHLKAFHIDKFKQRQHSRFLPQENSLKSTTLKLFRWWFLWLFGFIWRVFMQQTFATPACSLSGNQSSLCFFHRRFGSSLGSLLHNPVILIVAEPWRRSQ